MPVWVPILTLTMGLVTLIANIAMGIVLSRVSATTARLNRADDLHRQDMAAMRDEHAESIKTTRAENHDLTNKLLDERDRRISHSIANVAQQASNALIMVKEHALATDGRLQTFAQALPRLEVELVKTLNEARDFVRESAASRKDFDRHCEQSAVQQREINSAITELERKVVTTEDLKQVLRELRDEK